MTTGTIDKDGRGAADASTAPPATAHPGPFGTLAMVGISILLSILAIATTTTIPVNGGMGWDGQFYSGLARDFDWRTFVGSYNPYYMQRVLPGIIIGNILTLGNTPDQPSIVFAFQVLNLVCVALSAFGWTRIARHLLLAPTTAWAGYFLLAINFPLVANAFFYPTLTDIPAYTLGIWITYAFLRQSRWMLVVLGFTGAFVWPATSILCAMLILFCDPFSIRSDRPFRLNLLVVLLGAGGIVATGLGIRVILGKTTIGMGPVEPMVDLLAPVSATVHFLYLFAAAGLLIGRASVARVIEQIRQIRWWHVGLAVAVVTVPRVIIVLVASPEPPTLSLPYYIAMLAFLPIVKPGVTPVSHWAYFGLMVPIAILQWTRISRWATEYGLGAVVFLALMLALALTPESRQSMLTAPVLVVALACVNRRRTISFRALGGIFVVQMLLSRPYWRQDIGYDPTTTTTDLLPAYFANHGPYMAMKPYLVFGAALAVALIATWLYLRRHSPSGMLPR